jgi:hypothetical protein
MSAQDVSSDDKRTCSNDRCDLPMGSECHGRRWTDHLTEHVRAKETMDRLEAELKARGMTMFARIDQGRSTPSARHRFASPVFAKALHPPDRRTDASRHASRSRGGIPAVCRFSDRLSGASRLLHQQRLLINRGRTATDALASCSKAFHWRPP